MNKEEYLEKLKSCLRWHISKTELEDIMRDYAEYFEEGRRQSKTDSEISARLGDPKIVAEQIIEESHQEKTDRPDYVEAAKIEPAETKKEHQKIDKDANKIIKIIGEFFAKFAAKAKRFFKKLAQALLVWGKFILKAIALMLGFMGIAVLILSALAVLIFLAAFIVFSGVIVLLGVLMLILSGFAVEIISFGAGMVFISLALCGLGLGVMLICLTFGATKIFYETSLKWLREACAKLISITGILKKEKHEKQEKQAKEPEIKPEILKLETKEEAGENA